mmetsp:Transcript_89362/g.253200  ORF Transcript_89362/g.253200 Transcript_89362/m.253200 type:complete len:312 (+) Transcript_89362:592-1527(+)
MEVCHGCATRGKLLLEIYVRTAQQFGLPAGNGANVDALRQVLSAQDSCCCSHYLWPVSQEHRVDRRDLDEVVRQAKALLGPARPAQVPAQERVHRGLVHRVPEDPVHLLDGVPHAAGGARALRDEVQPRGQLRAVLRARAGVEPRGRQHAGDAGELELGAPDVLPRQVGVQVDERAEEQVLGVQHRVEGHRHVDPGQDLGGPVEEDRTHPRAHHGLPVAHVGHVQLQEHLAARHRKEDLLAHVGEPVPPEVDLLNHRLCVERLREGSRAGIPDVVVTQGQPSKLCAGGQRVRDRLDTSVADVVVSEAELSE